MFLEIRGQVKQLVEVMSAVVSIMLIKLYSLIQPFKSSPDTEDVMNCIHAWDTRLFKVLRVYPLLNIRSDKRDYL